VQERVLIRRIEPEMKTAGGIFIPDTEQEMSEVGSAKGYDNVYFIDEQSFERFQEMVRYSST
jgi:co-chaperonin GroES (HSP10)